MAQRSPQAGEQAMLMLAGRLHPSRTHPQAVAFLPLSFPLPLLTSALSGRSRQQRHGC